MNSQTGIHKKNMSMKSKMNCKKNRYDHEIKLIRVQGDMKGTRRVLNSILCKENGETTSIDCGDAEIDDDFEYFVESIIEINESIPKIDFIGDITPNPNHSFHFRCVSISEVKSHLKKLKNNTDEFFINPKVLLDAMLVIGQQLTSAINESFTTRVFPSALRKATIVPFQKVAGSTNIGDHRPINMLPCVERLIESFY